MARPVLLLLPVEGSALRQDSGGEGRTRGGLGMCRRTRLLEGEPRSSVLGDRAVVPPLGIGGARVAAVRERVQEPLTAPRERVVALGVDA